MALIEPIEDNITLNIFMTALPDRSRFESMYDTGAPWDIGRPQPAIVAAADRISGSVLDAGCGTGDTAIFLASRGCQVTGIDFLQTPIDRAKLKAVEQQVSAKFLVKDALMLADWPERFDNAIDSGLFHTFSDADRERYVAGLATVVNPGGRLYLMCFSDAEPGTEGPRRISQQELRAAFTHNWKIESISPYQFETRRDLPEFSFDEGSPRAWFMVAQRAE